MDSHFTVTIHDDYGVKQYHMHHVVKKIMIYLSLLFILIGFISVGTIIYLNSEVQKIEVMNLEKKEQNKNLKEINLNLLTNIETVQNKLQNKKTELDKISDSISGIETLIGISPVEDRPIQERVNLAKINSENMVTLLQFIPSGSPVPYAGITSKFGYRIHPLLKIRKFHKGIDLKATMKTPVYATADAMVEFSGYHKKSGFGNLIILQHNYGFKTYFGHLNNVVIKSGTFVKKGDLIAYSGNTGNSGGAHLHYEIRFMSRPVNPYWFIKWDVKNYNEIFEKEKKIPWQSLIKATAHIKVPLPTQAQPSSLPVQQSKVK